MMLRTARKQLTGGVELDVRAENVTDRSFAQKCDEPLRARAIRVDLVDHQATRQQKVAGEQQRGPVVVEDQVSRLMAGCRDDFDRASAERDARDAFWPFRQAERRAQVFDLCRHDLDSRQRCELRVACTVIAMPVRMQDQQRNLRSSLAGHQIHYCHGQRHLRRVFRRPRVDQQRLVLADEQIQQRGFEIRAQALAQNERLRLVLMDLQRRLVGLLAILGARVPLHVERASDRGGPGACGDQQQANSESLLHLVFLSIVSDATAALSAARAAAISDTTRKLWTKDSRSARSRAGRCAGATFLGTAASASLGTSACRADLTSAETFRRSIRSFAVRANRPTAIDPSNATASRPATRAVALLTPEATPA